MPETALIDALSRIHDRLAAHVRRGLETRDIPTLSRTVGETPGDIIYEIDRDVEAPLADALREELTPLGTFHVICEGLGDDETLMIPDGLDPADAERVVIIDPIDGTRGLMYGKRSAWILTGVAPGPAAGRTLEDITLAVQTELPTARSPLSDRLVAARGRGVTATTTDLVTGEVRPLAVQPSTAASVAGGFATIARYFRPGRDILARIEETVLDRVLGPAGERATVFEDQYISSAGCLYQLVTGKDRFVADLRAPLFDAFERDGGRRGHDCHPYDLCTALIAREAGVVVTGVTRPELSAPLDTTSPVGWAGYANETIRDEIEPVLLAVMREEGLT